MQTQITASEFETPISLANLKSAVKAIHALFPATDRPALNTLLNIVARELALGASYPEALDRLRRQAQAVKEKGGEILPAPLALPASTEIAISVDLRTTAGFRATLLDTLNADAQAIDDKTTRTDPLRRRLNFVIRRAVTGSDAERLGHEFVAGHPLLNHPCVEILSTKVKVMESGLPGHRPSPLGLLLPIVWPRVDISIPGVPTPAGNWEVRIDSVWALPAASIETERRAHVAEVNGRTIDPKRRNDCGTWRGKDTYDRATGRTLRLAFVDTTELPSLGDRPVNDPGVGGYIILRDERSGPANSVEALLDGYRPEVTATDLAALGLPEDVVPLLVATLPGREARYEAPMLVLQAIETIGGRQVPAPQLAPVSVDIATLLPRFGVDRLRHPDAEVIAAALPLAPVWLQAFAEGDGHSVRPIDAPLFRVEH